MSLGGRIEIVAHRGSNSDEPEHSLAAYLRALDEGADAVECDVRLTVDGTLVCVHDRRIDRTSTGRGSVSSKTLQQLSAYDYSGGPTVWRDFEEPVPDEARTAVLTLRALLAAMLDASPTVRFAIETKHPTRYGKYVEDALVEVLKHFGLAHANGDGTSRARVMSFSRMAVQRVVELAPGVTTAYLMENIPRRYRDGSLPEGVRIAAVKIDVLREYPRYVERVHSRGGEVHVWTVDERVDAELCANLGVEAIISNRPGLIREWLGV